MASGTLQGRCAYGRGSCLKLYIPSAPPPPSPLSVPPAATGLRLSLRRRRGCRGLGTRWRLERSSHRRLPRRPCKCLMPHITSWPWQSYITMALHTRPCAGVSVEAVTSSGHCRAYKHVDTVMLPMVCILFETSATNADSPCLASQDLHELALRSHVLQPERSFDSGTRHFLLNTLASSICYMRRVLQAGQPGRAADSATGAVCTALAASRPPGAARHGRGHHRRPVPAAAALQCAAASRCGMLLPQDEHTALECCVYVSWPPADGQ